MNGLSHRYRGKKNSDIQNATPSHEHKLPKQALLWLIRPMSLLQPGCRILLSCSFLL
jgi:hypothetical protein